METGNIRFAALQRHTPPLNHGELIAQPVRKIQKLFYQNDRDIAPVAQGRNDVTDVFDDVGLNALRWLIQQQQFGARDQRAGDGKLLLLTA